MGIASDAIMATFTSKTENGAFLKVEVEAQIIRHIHVKEVLASSTFFCRPDSKEW